MHKLRWPIQARQRVCHDTSRIENVVNTVAGERSFKLASIAEIDRYPRRRPHRLPMKNESLAKHLRHFTIRIENRAEEATVRAAILFTQFSQQAQRENGFACGASC